MDFKHTLLIAFLFIGINSFAQKRLEFNEIVSFSGTTFLTQTIQLDTVSVDKVIKVTSLNANSIYMQIIINNITYDYTEHSNNLSTPIWLKEGDILGIQSTSNGYGKYHISGIEFNIVE